MTTDKELLINRLRKIVEEQRHEIESLNQNIDRLRTCYETAKEEIEKLQSTIDEIKGIVGYPGEEALKKHGLSDSLPDRVRYLHRELLEQMYRAEQKYIQKDIEIDRLKQENEQLQAQAAVMREALKSIYYGPFLMHEDYKSMIEQALATDAGKDYHNPKDIEALEKAREALAKATYTEEILPNWEYKKIVYEAIEAIDKAIRGNQK